MPRLKFAMVCASNNNRSMEAHALLSKNNMQVACNVELIMSPDSEVRSLRDVLQVASFGVGNSVKLPGPSQKQPNIYKFGTPYQDIYNDLLKQNRDLYVKNGLLPMLERNMNVKQAPEKWQDNRSFLSQYCIKVCKHSQDTGHRPRVPFSPKFWCYTRSPPPRRCLHYVNLSLS